MTIISLVKLVKLVFVTDSQAAELDSSGISCMFEDLGAPPLFEFEDDDDDETLSMNMQ